MASVHSWSEEAQERLLWHNVPKDFEHQVQWQQVMQSRGNPEGKQQAADPENLGL